MLNFKRFFFLGLIGGVISVCSLAAQSQLERISITERGDGNGYVLRYHLTEMVNSYDLIQPEINRVQMQLFSENIDTEAVQMPELNEQITDVKLTAIDGGIGVDITTAENIFLRGEAYPDQNMRDLLVNFEYVSQSDIETIARETESYGWSVFEETESEAITSGQQTESTDEPNTQSEAEEERQQSVVKREPISVKIGISGGIGTSSKLGGNYASDSRQEFVMGLSAGISLPFVLPYSIKPGIETGVFFTQKGFLNPSTDQLDGLTVVLDYVEVPVLVRLRYDLTNVIKPKVLGGFYTAFRANAEIIQSNGDRNDLNDVTNSVDIGLMAGIGSDFLIESTNISLQLQYEAGIPPLFNSDFSSNERLGYLSLLMGVQF